jgi:hypothetical protein
MGGRVGRSSEVRPGWGSEAREGWMLKHDWEWQCAVDEVRWRRRVEAGWGGVVRGSARYFYVSMDL